MSFWKNLLGNRSGDSDVSEPSAEFEHDGYQISVTPQKEGGQYRLCAVISKELEGELKNHRLIRADLFTSESDCVDATVRKAKQVIKEQGDGIFS